MEVFPRISGRLGHPIDLNLTFYRNGMAQDPFAIRKVSIYRSAVTPENLIAEIPIVSICDPTYPAPLTRAGRVDGTGECGTIPPTPFMPGEFHLIWDVPKADIPVPDIFFDVWSYIAKDPIPGNNGTGGGGTVCDPKYEELLDDEGLWNRTCCEFWLFPDSTYADCGLENIRLGFEALDIKFRQPEKRTLEVGMMPLPLYDFNYNMIAPIIPFLKGKFTLMTENCELLIEKAPMKIGIRQGTYRSNPFTLQYLFDTTKVLKGSYKYRVEVELPNGESRASPDFYLQVS